MNPWDSGRPNHTETWSLNQNIMLEVVAPLDSVGSETLFLHTWLQNGCFPKIRGNPPNHPWINRVFHYFHHPFWGGFSPYFWTHRYVCTGNAEFMVKLEISFSEGLGVSKLPTRLKTVNVLGSLFANTKPTCLAGNIQCQLECLISGSFDLVRHTVWFCF